jgi:hypothetical protein
MSTHPVDVPIDLSAAVDTLLATALASQTDRTHRLRAASSTMRWATSARLVRSH